MPPFTRQPTREEISSGDALARLRESEARFRLMADATPDVIWITELQPERVVYASPSFERIWGRKVEDLYRDPHQWIQGIHPDDRERVGAEFMAWIGHMDRLDWQAEFRVVHHLDGSVRWIHDRGVALSEENGVRRVSGISTDITARRRAEAALRESEERFTLAVSGLADGVWDWDIASDVMYMSDRAQRLYGLEPGLQSRLRSEWLALMRPSPPEDMKLRRDLVADYLSGRVPTFEGEWRVCHADGVERWIQTRGVCTRDASGRAIRLTGSISDIDARKRAEQALRQSEERHARAMEAARDGHWDWIAETDEYYASPRMLEIYGFAPGTRFRGRQDFQERVPLHPEDRIRWQQAAAEFFAGREARFDIDLRMLIDGRVVWVRTSGLLTRDAAGRPKRYTGSVNDITQRKAAEAALQESEQRFALAVAGSNDGIWDWDIVTDNMFFSERAQALYGLDPGQTARPRSQWRRMTSLHPDDVPSQSEMLEGYLAGRLPTYDGEWRVRHADGSHRWVRIRGVCVRDALGKPMRMAGSVSDIDASKRAEAALQQAQRLEAVGTLASGIAHDFNNILGAILGFGEMALRRTRPGSRIRRDLESIVTAGERGRSLVDRILAFSRTGVSERVPVHVEGVVQEALNLISASLPASIRIESELHAAGAATLGDSTQMHQVLMNLATNAIQAMPKGGTLRVALDARRLGAPRLVTTGPLEAGDYLVIAVSDSGHGIPAEIRARIFDPFFTTKDVGAGTGLGLSLVHGIVSELGGAVDVSTSLGTGSTFSVYLPRTGDAVETPEESIQTIQRGVHEQVLVVDDEESLVRWTCETLAELGYVPVGFTSGAEALAAFTAHPERFDALVTDERMPGLSGTALIRALRRIRPTIPAVMVSGHLGTAIVGRAREAGAAAVLRKPLARGELAGALTRALRVRTDAPISSPPTGDT